MKRLLGATVVAVAIGVWYGVRAWQSASVTVNNDAVLAILLGGNLVLCIWVWCVARPRSGAVKAMPIVAALTVAMLLGILPRLFWPAGSDIQRTGTIASLIVSTGVSLVQIRRIVTEIRRRRRLHRGAMTV